MFLACEDTNNRRIHKDIGRTDMFLAYEDFNSNWTTRIFGKFNMFLSYEDSKNFNRIFTNIGEKCSLSIGVKNTAIELYDVY